MSIPTLRQADNGFYYAFWTSGRRSKRATMGTGEAAEAQRRFAHWLLARENAHRPGDIDYSVAQLWVVYWEKHGQNVAAPDTLLGAWKNLWLHFGRCRLSDINQDTIDDYEKKRAAGKIGQPAGGSTARRELGALRACLNWCAAPKRKIITPAQVPHFDLPAEGEPRDRWLRTEEIDRLLSATFYVNEVTAGWPRVPRGERFLRLALETAARKTALLELTWDRVDFETGMIHLNVPGRKLTKKRRANVPISATLRPHLERWHRERINDLVLDNSAEIWKAIQIIAARAGLEGVSPHVLRHTAATHMARRGVPLYDIAGVLGNSLAMVEKVYAHHCPDRLRAAVDNISGGTNVKPE